MGRRIERGKAVIARTVTPFEAIDLRLLDARQEESAGLSPALWNAAELFAAGRAFTVWTRGENGNQRPVWCGGAVEQHEGHATLWSSFAKDFPPELGVFLTLAARRFVSELRHARVDALVRAGTNKAPAWLRMLGFEQEARMACWFPDGADLLIFRRENG